MVLDLQFRIKNDERLRQFLRDNSYYYKYLNRSPSYLKEIIEDMKDKYGMRPSDRINKMIDNISLMNSFFEALR